ncbi:hypothetical protein Trco_002491 [Trichoderma cornu-damae]|uniref:Uncharacterized protein n=1 Tax=Trichoderma cornu-damae TaxID=654480 RepID=A0A9P8QPG1_9HYPO|nr:hypothetical protein Trco_002491 [Trichoderma cornu-damae]
MDLQLPLRRQSINEFLSNLSTMSRAQRELRQRTTSIADANRIQEITSATPQRTIKRRRTSASPISISSTPPQRVSRRVKSERDKLFDAIEAGDNYPAGPTTIKSADDLNEVQLKKCYEILHACGSATDPNASLTKTRQSIDGFLDAVFNEWSSRKAGTLLRSELDFLVEADVVAGRLCAKPQEHIKATDCDVGSLCAVTVSAVATYCNNPPMFKLEFSTVDDLSGQPEAFCPISRRDIRWLDKDWMQELRDSLQAKVIAKIHKHNKHLAIWQARKLIVEWAKGSLSMGEDVSKMGFLERRTADVATIGLGGHIQGK